MATTNQVREAVSAPTGGRRASAWARFYPPFRLSVEQYEKIVDSGVFTKRDRLQLVDGLLVEKVTQNPPHAVVDVLVKDALEAVMVPGWHIRPDKPVRLPPDGEPEPDHCIVRGKARDYLSGHPGAEDVGLLVEIADSNLEADRAMRGVYGPRGIPVYWIVNIPESQLEVYSSPTSEGYAVERVYKRGDEVPVVLDGEEVGRIKVSDILP
jgi:Uma2 family endonuclease